MADLSTYSLEETSVLHVRAPNGEETDVKIELYNRFTRHYQRQRAKVYRSVIQARGDVSDTEIDESTDRLLAACTAGWENLEWEGQAVEFSEEKAFELYSNPKLSWLREQVDEYMHRAGNFLGKSKKG